MTPEEKLQQIKERLASGDEYLTSMETCIAYAAKIAPQTALQAVKDMLAAQAVVDVAQDLEEYFVEQKGIVNWEAVAADEGIRLTAAIDNILKN